MSSAGRSRTWKPSTPITAASDRGSIGSPTTSCAMRSAAPADRGWLYVRWSTREGSHETDPAAQIAAAVDAESDLCAVTAVLELQSTEDVETLLMFAWEQLSYAEIAEVLSIPIGTVSSRISRIRRHLHEVLDGELVHLKCATRFLGGTE